jgi:hypothetical protein
LDAEHEALRATVLGLRARLGKFGLRGFGVAGGLVKLGYHFNKLGNE